MSRKTSVRRIQDNHQDSSSKRTERTPLLEGDNAESSANNKSIHPNDSSNQVAGVSWGVAAFLLVNTALGAGMLNYPYAYNQIGGILAATLIQIVLLIFIISTMFILVYCADFNQDDTYHDVLMSMCGKRAQQISAISILLTCYGINVTFLVIIGDQYDRIFESLLYDHLDSWFLDRKFTIFVTAILFIWPMCYAQRLDFLRHASILGMFAMLYVAFLTVYEHYQLDEATISKFIANRAQEIALKIPNNSSSTMTSQLNTGKSVLWFEPVVVVPVLCFAYQTHEVIVPVYACMKQRSIGLFMKASVFGLVILFLLYNIVGAYGYLTFGADVGPDIMSLYDAKDPVVVIGIVALVIKFITTYPPLMFCGRSALDGLYGEFGGLSPTKFKSSEKSRRIIITTLWFFSTVALAAFAPNISVTLQLLGSMASINVFVFPGMCLISLTRRLREARRALLIDETHQNSSLNQQRGQEFYIVSENYIGTASKNTTKSESVYDHHVSGSYHNESIKNRPPNFTATFADLMELDMNASCRFGENSANNASMKQHRSTNYGSQLTRLEEIEAPSPSTASHVGISRSTAIGLYLFSALLILFGAIIFVLELVHVFGLL